MSPGFHARRVFLSWTCRIRPNTCRAFECRFQASGVLHHFLAAIYERGQVLEPIGVSNTLPVVLKQVQFSAAVASYRHGLPKMMPEKDVHVKLVEVNHHVTGNAVPHGQQHDFMEVELE
jgi:hypothetical protein